MTMYQLSCIVNTSNPDANLGLEVWLDNHVLFDAAHITHETLPLEFDLTEDDAEHELRFVMKGKTSADTSVDANGTITNDAVLTISNVAFNGVKLGQLLVDHATYTHDFNGTKEPTTEKFYGTMGCNGVVSLKFTTPVHIWYLENN